MKTLFNLPSIRGYPARFEMLKHLAQKLDDLIVVTNEKDVRYMINLPDNLEVVELPKNKIKFFLGLLTETDFKNIDIVHDTFGYLLPLGFLTKMFPSKKYVTSVYGSAPGWLHRAKEWGCPDKEEMKGHYKLLFRERVNSIFCDSVLMNSEFFIKDYVEDFGYPVENIDIIPNCVLMDDVEFTENGNESFNILYVGHISKMKGAYIILDAFQKILADGYDANLVVIGKFIPYDKKVIEGKTLKNVKFIEHMPHYELKKYYLNSDLYVHPSYQEGMPKTIMEALSYGVPVIASNLPGIRMIDNSNNYVQIMKDFESDTLKSMIVEEILKPRKSEKYFHLARGHIKEFSPEKTANMIYEIYKKVLSH